MKIIKLWSLQRGEINPPEPLDEKENEFVSQLWHSYDISVPTKIVRREYDWFEGAIDSVYRSGATPESEFSS